ncbi:MAG: hypothetical protein KIT80_02255 [Chitinophagaceae bacterium]|nr:hypothetical protein [Chitinophagaceae bacterium]MCW5925708.1 hypothetical protein [Chitinophagaceae bacterium]
MKSTLLFSFSLFLLDASGQTLTISNAGQTGTSGTNWTTSGSNPVTINVTGTANINTSVIAGYLNAGNSVIVNNTTVGTTINSGINKTAGAAASLTFRDVGPIWVNQNVSISSTANTLDIILWADTDNSQGGTVSDYVATGAGVTFASNGGKIVMAGGPDNGSNGGISGDGIPDGFAWNGSNATNYGANTVGGLTLGPRSGTGIVVSLLSNGGDIILRGATSGNNSYPGITSQGRLRIESGAGKITMYGRSVTGHGIELTYGAAPSVAISSSSVSTPAIDISGTTTVAGYTGFWASNNASGNILIQSTAATGGGVTIEGTSNNNSGIRLGTSNTNITAQVLSQAGTVTFKGRGGSNASLLLYGDVYVGNRKDAAAIEGVIPAVTGTAANILIQANDQYQFSNTSGRNTTINSTGSLTMEAYTAGYTGTVSWTGNAAFGSGFSSITLGESAENYDVTLNNTLTAAGNITAYANNFTLANGVGLISSVAGTININARGNFNRNGTTRRIISTVNGDINIYADADANGSGQLDIGYITFNPGSGNIRLRTETLSWTTTNNTDKPYINGTGSFTIEPADASFQAVSTSWFFFDQDANGIAGLTIGKNTNTGNITHETTALNIAGPVNLYGGLVSLTANLTSSANGDIFLKANTNQNGSAALNNTASILKTAGTGTLTMQSQARLNSGTITASGSGMLNVILWSDYGNNNNGGVSIAAVTTNGGHVWLGGSNTANGSYTWNGLVVGNGPSVGSSNNNHNAIDFHGPVSTSGGDVLLWGGNGYAAGTSGFNVMQPSRSINAGAGNITFIADNIEGNDLNISTTGILTLVPDGGSYPAAITWNGVIASGTFNASNNFDRLNILNFASLGGLVIGYYNQHISSGVPVVQNNSSNITVSAAASIAGPVTLYGTGLTISQNLASTAVGNISLFGNTLSIGGSATLSSGGNLIIEPVTAATTIGLTGGAGTLAITTANFNTNFSDGFSEIRIGNAAAGNITFNTAIATKDNLRLTTNGSLLLNEILEIGNNDLRFVGNTIVPADNKFVKTNGVGKLIMEIGNNAGKLFPLGIDHYNPVTITNHTGVTDAFYATASLGVFYEGSTGGTAVTWSPRIDLTWNIGNTAASTGVGNVDLAFGWNAANVAGALNTPRLVHHNGTIWEQLPGTPAFDLDAGTLTYTGYTGTFSPFGIAEANLMLPVTWVSFTGKKVQNEVVLNWITASEQNNAYFEIERSTDGIRFVSIGTVKAGRQNADSPNAYHYTDYRPEKGRSYYRLKQVDHDGRNSYSSIVTLFFEGNDGIKIVVVPGSKQLVVSVPSQMEGKVEVVIFDSGGRRLMRKQIISGQNNIIQTGFVHAKGIYFLSVVRDGRLIFSDRFVH